MVGAARSQPRFRLELGVLPLVAAIMAVICVWLVVAEIRETIRERRGKLEPWHLVTIGLAGVWLFATIALGGLIWRYYNPTDTLKIEVTSAPAKGETKPKSELEWGFEVHRMSPIGLSAPDGK